MTTVTNDPIPKEQMGNATSIFNLMRNIGARFGIAGVATMLERNTQVNTNILAAHVTSYNAAAQQMLENSKAMFMARGADAATATRQAYTAMFGLVQQQAAMLSFIDVFRLLGILFLVVIPLIFVMKRPQRKAAPGAGAH